MLTHAVCMTLVLAASAYTARGCAARCWGPAEARRRGPFHPPPGGPLGEAIRTKQTVQVADVAATQAYASNAIRTKQTVQVADVAATQAYDASRAGRVSAAAWPANARIRAALRHQSALGVAGFGQGLIGFFGARIARVAFGSARHLDLLDVPYRGGAPALTDLLAGHVHVIFDNLPTSLEYIRAGKLRPLAVSTATRSDILPDLPTVSEFVPGYEVSSWFGIGAPRNTPTQVVDKLNAEINAGLTAPKLKAQLTDLGSTPLMGSPTFGKLIVEETEKWGKVIR